MFNRRNNIMNNSALALSTQADLVKLSAESNMNVQQLQSAAQAQGAMLAAAEQIPHIEIPKVNFYPSVHANPRKRRRTARNRRGRGTTRARARRGISGASRGFRPSRRTATKNLTSRRHQ